MIRPAFSSTINGPDPCAIRPLGDIRRDPPGFGAAQQFSGRKDVRFRPY